MSIAEKLTQIAENEQKVFEAGRKKEQSDFWSNYPSGTTINYAFAYQCFNDDTYNPTKDIIMGKYSSYSFLYYSSIITDTKVAIDVSKNVNDTESVFRSSKLKTIRKIIVSETITFNYWFRACSALENITFEGVIGQNIDFSGSPLLKVESILNIFECLKDITGTETTKTCTLGSTNIAKLTDEQKAIATEKGWTLA